MTAAIPWVLGALGLYQAKKASDAMRSVSIAPPPTPAPVVAPAAVQAGEPLKDVAEVTARAREDQKRKAAGLAGYGGTQKTGGLGVPGPAMTQGKSLLGQ